MKGTDGVTVGSPAWLKMLAVAGFSLLAALTSLPVWGQAPAKEMVAEVVVTGNRNIPTEKIMRFINTRAGNEYLQSTLQGDVIRLTESRMFKNVRPYDQRTGDGRVRVVFEVQEYPNLIREIIYRNAHHISEKELAGMTRLRKGMPLDPTSNKNACFEIQDYLKKKGRYFASVTLEEGDKPTANRVIFNVSEGPIVRVRSINFEGHDKLASSARLRTQIEASRMFLGLPIGAIFNPPLIDNDALKLEEYYKDNGYIHVRVARELIFSDDFSKVDVVFHIHEGQRHRVKDFQIDGNKTFEDSQLRSIIQTKKGEFYNGHIVQADVRNLQDYEGWRGFSTVVNKEVYTIPEEPGMVRVQFDIKERPPAKVGQVFIVGNDVTQDRVIRRVIGLYPGQTLRYPELRIAERDLARLNIFKVDPENGIRPSLIVLDPDGEAEFKDILVQVQETQTGSLMFGAGFNSDSGIVGSIVLNERNFDIFRFPTSLSDIWEGRAFRGAGQELRMEAVPGTQLQRYSISFREPFLFDRPYSLTLGAYYNQRYFDEYLEGRTGGRFSIGHALSKEWTISVGGRVENVNVSNITWDDPPDYFAVRGNNFQMGANVGLSWDTRDSFLRPTEGGIVSGSYEQIFGDYNFPILNLEASRYFTTYQRQDGSGKQVVALRSQVAWCGDNTPVYERFFAGGFRTIRGFQFRGVGPFINGHNNGGDFMLLNSLEYQVPIRANDQLYLVAFLDSGTVEQSVEIRDYRVSAGIGLRITVPMMGPVPIALDFGFPIVHGPSDRQQVFSFWVGLFR